MKNLNHPRCKQSLLPIAIGMLFAGCASIPPPTEQLAVSKAALSNASSAGGQQFAPVPLSLAIEKMDAAAKAMAVEDYVLARRLAEQAQVDAQLATVTSRSAKAQNAARELQESNRVLRQEIDRKAQ